MPKKPASSKGAAKKQQDAKEPWNTQFEDDRDDSGSYSRVVRRKHSRGNTVMTWVIVALLVIVCLTPIVWRAVSKRMANTGDSQTRISVATSSSKQSSEDAFKSSSKKAKASADSKASSSAKASSSSSAVQSSSSASTTSSAQSSSSSSTSSSSSSSSTASGSYTVKSGDNLYRIAVNHGMTLAEIQQLNGMGSSISITPGQTLKVK
ncbi:LysM peptidoglycan-binding domain-containing protein [Lacticaseibacillus zhaodongensis]|uniref:LysM peptidoglycan-binding domain-containing protein n=1 Tax=Lacticaseibacillus zhaodongensis TaxID=2668065 RepID=UPI0018AF8B7A|nr:LysM domain-containing protein [Lacticaseibacillus zhaodongensis]